MAKPPREAVVSDTLVSAPVHSVAAYLRSGQPWVWMSAAAISITFMIACTLLTLIAARGLPHFWPSDLLLATYAQPGEPPLRVLAEIRDSERVPTARLRDAGLPVAEDRDAWERLLIKVGNRELMGMDFRYALSEWLVSRSRPADATVLERTEWGHFHGFLRAVREDGVRVDGDAAWAAYERTQRRATDLRERIHRIETERIGAVNHALERLRLQARRLELDGRTEQTDPQAHARLAQRRAAETSKFDGLKAELDALRSALERDAVIVRTADGRELELPLSRLIRGWQPNAMSLPAKIGFMFARIGDFVTDDPREANTEGGIFPAIFGTVMMVMIMSAVVTPFGILAALYLREYARQGIVTQAIRIAVNNLAGVPSIVFGMFGLGFFVYFLGGGIDRLFHPEAAPAPVFGTPGILWASLTLALLTLPVVIVATEEGLSRIPRSLREASLALGATQAETLWRVVLPMASPAMMTGLILAIARAAGEVAPLMLVGVVKLAPALPLDGNIPYLHLERKFMHLGFHLYDVGFQSPNVEAARPLVYATAFMLVLVILLLNLAAIGIRNRLRERYRALES